MLAGNLSGSSATCNVQKTEINGLPPALVELLQAAVELETTKTAPLAAKLNRSRHTMNTEFCRIMEILRADTRGGAVLIALEPLERGIVRFNRDVASEEGGERETGTEAKRLLKMYDLSILTDLDAFDRMIHPVSWAGRLARYAFDIVGQWKI